MDKLGKRDSLILYFGIILPIMLFIAIIVISDSLKYSSDDIYYQDRSARSFHGVIDSIYRQKDNHNVMTVVSGKSIFGTEGIWESKIKLGDSISKEAGDLYLKVFRGGNEVDSLSYLDVLKK